MILNPKKEGRTGWWEEEQQKRKKKKLPKLSEIFPYSGLCLSVWGDSSSDLCGEMKDWEHPPTLKEKKKIKRSQRFFSLKISTCA